MTDFNSNARYQRINDEQKKNKTMPLTAALDDYFVPRWPDAIATVSIAIITIIAVVLMFIGIKGCSDSYKQPPKALNCQMCHGLKVKMVEYFKRNEVKNPQAMAEAVMATKSPRLMAAINVGGEKKTPHTARNTGYKRQHSGAWQVNAKTWGRVSRDVTEQALQAELVLIEHLKEEKTIIPSLNAYGGERNKVNGRYAYNVLAELYKVP